MTPIELLAPAKNLHCGIAAIDHGADAVYIGAYNFGARHAAGNSVEDIRQLCAYAHQYGAKVYATVNTVIYDDEMDEAVRLVNSLADAGVDAILVQDMGLLKLVAESNCHTAFHASTQTDNRTAEKVQWLRSLGFSRVVLARELTTDEILAIHTAVPDVELEVFVHGALCVSYSGQCYASEACLGRSANRGECAQMCRMKYALEDANGHSIADDAYYLSLKDQCQIDNLQEIIDAGACSLKIEGRLKDVAYVKNVVAAYSQRLDDIIRKSNGKYCRASWGRAHYSFTPDLNKSFNRGYTDYFLYGRNRNIASFYTPKAIGEYVGKVKEIRQGRQPSFNVATTAAFVNGDGLCYLDRNGNLCGFRVNRAEGNRLYPLKMPADLRSGTPLYRSQDQAFDKLMAGKTAERLVPLTMTLEDHNTELHLNITGLDAPLSGHAVLELSERQQAQKPQLENIKRQLSKLGGTIYSCDSFIIDRSLDALFIPASQMADLRRRAIETITVTTPSTPVLVRHRFDDVASSAPNDTYHTRYTYLHNAVNAHSRTFYAARGVTVSDDRVGQLLMQCRHCIRYALGYCVKNGGKRPDWKEPLHLRLGDGRRFRLDFDCRNCQMNVLSAD